MAASAPTLTLGVLTVKLADISNKDNPINKVWDGKTGATTPPDVTATRKGRLSPYEPLVVRASDHPYDKYGTGAGQAEDAEHMALFESRYHGAPWVMVGQQPTHLIHDGKAPITDTQPYSVIYVNHDYTQFV